MDNTTQPKRKRKPPKSILKKVRMTTEEWSAIEARIPEGSDFSKEVRSLLMTGERKRAKRRRPSPESCPYDPQLTLTTVLIGRFNRTFGNNLNQIARALNEARRGGGINDAHVLEALLELRGIRNEIERVLHDR